MANICGVIRRYQGHLFVAVFGRNISKSQDLSENPEKNALLQYTVNFCDQVLPLLIANNLSLKYSRFVQDEYFRKAFILGKYIDIKPQLSTREMQRVIHLYHKRKLNGQL